MKKLILSTAALALAAGFAAAFYQPMSERDDLFAPPADSG